MLVVSDAMVLIHLAKMTLLERVCEHFCSLLIPPFVHREVVRSPSPDAMLIRGLLEKKKISVRIISQTGFLEKAKSFSIFGGEAEALALYWQEEADYLATDDDNVRKKKSLLDLRLFGTPAILLTLYTKHIITKEKFISSVDHLKTIGWFNPALLDGLRLEADKHE